MNPAEVSARLLQELAVSPDICLVIGPNDAVCEAFVDPATMDFRLDGPYVTMENGAWHMHLNTASIQQVFFEVKPDPHNHERLSYSVHFRDAQGTALLRAFFLDMYDAQGGLRPERLQAYETLRARAGE